jgi:hypothetical protein
MVMVHSFFRQLLAYSSLSMIEKNLSWATLQQKPYNAYSRNYLSLLLKSSTAPHLYLFLTTPLTPNDCSTSHQQIDPLQQMSSDCWAEFNYPTARCPFNLSLTPYATFLPKAVHVSELRCLIVSQPVLTAFSTAQINQTLLRNPRGLFQEHASKKPVNAGSGNLSMPGGG